MKAFLCFVVMLTFFSAFAQEESMAGRNSSSQESIRPLRVGLRLGVPNLGALNVEYVTPLWENRISGAIDYMPLAINVGDEKLSLSTFEIGSNIYFNTNGRGFYGGISYFSFNGDVTISDIDFDNGTDGTGKANFKFGTFNLKLGVKLGRTFYFRSEVGYGFGRIPQHIVFTGEHPSQSSLEEIPPIPGISEGGNLIFNIGFGVGFL